MSTKKTAPKKAPVGGGMHMMGDMPMRDSEMAATMKRPMPPNKGVGPEMMSGPMPPKRMPMKPPAAVTKVPPVKGKRK